MLPELLAQALERLRYFRSAQLGRREQLTLPLPDPQHAGLWLIGCILEHQRAQAEASQLPARLPAHVRLFDAPVSGLFPPTEHRPAVVSKVSPSHPDATISVFSRPSASHVGRTSRSIRCAMNERPPHRSSSSSRG